MSELRTYYCTTIQKEHTEFYIKSEADKVIAELKNEIEKQKQLRDMALASVPNVLKVMKIIQHHEFKRCLGKAEWCESKVYHIRRTPLGDMSSHEYWQYEDEFWQRWQKRWLKIADQFKPNSTVPKENNNG